MRISDWSSDVCSSDLGSNCTGAAGDDIDIRVPLGTRIFDAGTEELIGELTYEGQRVKVAQGGHRGLGNPHFKSSVNRTPYKATKRSEEHTSELQSLMRISYAVFCLKKKNH